MTSPLKYVIINTERNKKGNFKMKIYTAKKDMGNGFSAQYKVKAENLEEARKLIREISGENLKIKEV